MANGAKLLAEEYTKNDTKHKRDLSKQFWWDCECYYRKDSNGRHYRMEKDEVIEVTTEAELEAWHSSCVKYIDKFMRVSNGRRNLFGSS